MVISFFMCVMAAGMGMTMAPATESVMGSLPREKAGVGSAINDTTRQVGGALGVAIIGSDRVERVRRARSARSSAGFGITGADAQKADGVARRRAGGVVRRAGDRAPRSSAASSDGFVDALSIGLAARRGGGGLAAIVAWKFLPARGADHVADALPITEIAGEEMAPAVGS